MSESKVDNVRDEWIERRASVENVSDRNEGDHLQSLVGPDGLFLLPMAKFGEGMQDVVGHGEQSSRSRKTRYQRSSASSKSSNTSTHKISNAARELAGHLKEGFRRVWPKHEDREYKGQGVKPVAGAIKNTAKARPDKNARPATPGLQAAGSSAIQNSRPPAGGTGQALGNSGGRAPLR